MGPDGDVDHPADGDCSTPEDRDEQTAPRVETPGADSGTSDSSGCGLGFEIALILPLLRRRTRRALA